MLMGCAGFAFAEGAEPLFDGETLAGWQGDAEVWRVEDGAIVGGSMEGNPRNEFLTTEREFGDFRLKLRFKIVGTRGLVNGGVQLWSQRVADAANEMEGFQADIGAGHTGAIYDESRRRKFLVRPEKELIERLEKKGEWNDYEIVARAPKIEIFLNGEKVSEWVEADGSIPVKGKLGLQIHGNSHAEISFRGIELEEL